MKIIDIKSLEIPEIRLIRFARFSDERGYFTEAFRKSDFFNHPQTDITNPFEFFQLNESYSKARVIRGLHAQWNPFMGKLVRITMGHMIDLALDIRKDSKTYGKIIGYEMFPSQNSNSYDECLWIPPGFAHGFFFMKNSKIEYLCSGEHNPKCEVAISPLAGDIDWSLCGLGIKEKFDSLISSRFLISEKDRNAMRLKEWSKDERSQNFYI